MSKNPSILIIDDESQIRRLLEITLETHGFETIEAVNGKEGLHLAASHHPQLIILDLGLDDIPGHEVLKQLREWYTRPIIILSVQSSEEDIVRALDNGANDYLIKPFRTNELMARIRSAFRNTIYESESDGTISLGDINIDLTNRLVKKAGVIIKLTATEYKILALFARQSGKVLTHGYLLREIWGPGYVNQSQYLRVFIAQLRKKIEEDPNRPRYILTQSGVGYRFSEPD
jgi:two-component system KDP operon response regulator KdpE